MLDIPIPEPVEGRPSNRVQVSIVKARDTVEIETSALPDDVYNEALALGLKVLCNREQSKITGTTYPDEQERAEVAAETAKEVIAKMYLGKIKRTSGAAKASKGSRSEEMIEAKRLATIYVKADLKEAGLRVSLIKPAEIRALVTEAIENDPEIMEEARENIRKRGAKTKGRKIDVAALKARVKEDAGLVAKSKAKSSSRKRPSEDEEEVDAPPPVRGRPGPRLSA